MLPPAPSEVRVIADRLVDRAVTSSAPPVLGVAIANARQAMATTSIGDEPFDDEGGLKATLEDMGVAVLSILARLRR
jgi:hypothetical protein